MWLLNVPETSRRRLAALALFCLAVSGCGGGGGGAGGMPLPPTIASQPQNTSVPVGQSATFTVIASGSGSLTYQWSRNGSMISGATSSTYTLATTGASDNGASFVVTVSDAGGSVSSAAAILSVTFSAQSGVAEKGPLIKGSTVTAQELDPKLSPTGKQYSYQTNSDLGTFSPTSTFTSQYIGLNASGYYFDEVVGAISSGPITLNGYSDLSATTVLNVNLLTTLAYQRIQNLVATSGFTFLAAETQAQREVLAAFSVQNAAAYGDFNSLDLSKSTDGDHILAAISSLMVQGNSAGTLSALIANVQSDIAANGGITSATTKAQLLASAQALNTASVALNLTGKYASVGATFTASDVSDWIDTDGDGLTGKFKFLISRASSTSTFAFPSFVSDPFAGTPLSVSSGQLFLNGTLTAGPVTTKAGDVVSVAPGAGFATGSDAVYLLGGSTRIGRASFNGHNTWSPASALLTTRASHTATLLQDGRVLVAGGYTGQCGPNSCSSRQALSSAEIYDPKTDTWSTAGNMAVPRVYHTAVLLPTGKVLVAGGTDLVSAYYSSAELFDPTNSTWSSAGNMTSIRLEHTASVLANGKVLVAGGTDSTTPTPWLATAELYDPVANTWTATGALSEARYFHAASQLNDGRVLVAGGVGPQGVPATDSLLASAEIYDPSAGQWSSAGNMTVARENGFNATLLQSGKVLVVGGNSVSGLTTASDIYDPTANTWTTGPSMPSARGFHTATALPSGQALIAGGEGPQVIATALFYDPPTNSWLAVPSMNWARGAHAAVRLSDGSVLVIGGLDVTYNLSGTCEAYW